MQVERNQIVKNTFERVALSDLERQLVRELTPPKLISVYKAN